MTCRIVSYGAHRIWRGGSLSNCRKAPWIMRVRWKSIHSKARSSSNLRKNEFKVHCVLALCLIKNSTVFSHPSSLFPSQPYTSTRSSIPSLPPTHINAPNDNSFISMYIPILNCYSLLQEKNYRIAPYQEAFLKKQTTSLKLLVRSTI